MRQERARYTDLSVLEHTRGRGSLDLGPDMRDPLTGWVGVGGTPVGPKLPAPPQARQPQTAREQLGACRPRCPQTGHHTHYVRCPWESLEGWASPRDLGHEVGWAESHRGTGGQKGQMMREDTKKTEIGPGRQANEAEAKRREQQ